MAQYGILNTRKRTIIALVHTVVFGLLAAYQFAIRQHPLALVSATRGKMAGPIALTMIYLIVTVVLLILFRYSRSTLERLYFSLCSTSAAIGLVRAILGDPTQYAELAARVMLLGCAIIAGALILRTHSQPALEIVD